MILVTGGTGLLGSYFLLQLARRSKKVRILARENAPKHEVYNLFKIYEPSNFNELYEQLEWVEGDVLDLPSLGSAFTGISEVYHIAGKVSFNEKELEELYKVNVEGTKNMVNLSIDFQVKKFCFISTIAALDPKFESKIINEKAEWNFKYIHSSYAASKYAAEMEVWRASQEGLNVIVVNPGIILGSGNWERSSGMLYDLCMSRYSFYTSGTTGYIDAEDVAEVSVRLMESKVCNQKYILVSENVSYEKVFKYLRNYFHKKPAKKISDFWLNKLAFLSRCLPLRKNISKAAVLGVTGTSCYSNEKIKETLKYTFIPLEESLEKHASNYLKYKYKRND